MEICTLYNQFFITSRTEWTTTWLTYPRFGSKVQIQEIKTVCLSFSFQVIWITVIWIIVKKLMFWRICRIVWSGLARAKTQLINNKVHSRLLGGMTIHEWMLLMNSRAKLNVLLTHQKIHNLGWLICPLWLVNYSNKYESKIC